MARKITGPWQVAGRNHTSFSERVRMDAHYVRDWSIWLDLVLLARTVKIVLSDGGLIEKLRRRGARSTQNKRTKIVHLREARIPKESLP